ncbi:MAG TPA: hypothetical protein VJ302_17220, partial [Blastocatellia bacterium]|nr:hypothetical protein [Blastocatellia bacterium]
MRRFSRTTGERGFSSLELTLTMPLIVFSILFLIGMGHVLITKQHAMVGAQFAANHHRVKEAGPSAAQVGQSVSAGTEVFRLDGGGDEEIGYTASTTPERGLIAEKYRLTDAVSKYQTLTGTGACEPDCTPLVAVTRIISVEMIAGIIFSGNDGGLADITDAVGGIGGKGRGRNRGGAPGQANGQGNQ